MNKVTIFLQVYFEEPFWVGIFETIQNGQLSASKVTFGSEPKDCEIQAYIMDCFYRLRFSPSIQVKSEADKKINPKRQLRQVKRQLENLETGKKSWQVLKLQQEKAKEECHVRAKQRNEEKKQHIYELRQQKKKDKLKGR